MSLPSAKRFFALVLAAAAAWYGLAATRAAPAEAPLHAGFAEEDITPEVGGASPVYLAGFGQNRKATGVHDPLKARAVVLTHGKAKVALASVDVVGLFLPSVARVRGQLPGFTYMLV